MTGPFKWWVNLILCQNLLILSINAGWNVFLNFCWVSTLQDFQWSRFTNTPHLPGKSVTNVAGCAVQGRTEISAILQEGHWTLGGNDRISEAGEFGWPMGRVGSAVWASFFRKNVKEVWVSQMLFFFCRRQTVYYRYISLFFYPYLFCAKLRWATIEKHSKMLFAPPMFASIYKRNFPATSCLWQKIFQEQKWTLLGFEQKSHFWQIPSVK